MSTRVKISKKDWAFSPKEKIEDRIKIGHLKCPKCRHFFGFYKDEFYEEGRSRKLIRHSCGFREAVCLEDFLKEDD